MIIDIEQVRASRNTTNTEPKKPGDNSKLNEKLVKKLDSQKPATILVFPVHSRFMQTKPIKTDYDVEY